MYDHTYSKSKDQPGKVANPARGQPNRENECFPVRYSTATRVLGMEGRRPLFAADCHAHSTEVSPAAPFWPFFSYGDLRLCGLLQQQSAVGVRERKSFAPRKEKDVPADN